jgi:hypothetical protein
MLRDSGLPAGSGNGRTEEQPTLAHRKNGALSYYYLSGPGNAGATRKIPFVEAETGNYGFTLWSSVAGLAAAAGMAAALGFQKSGSRLIHSSAT